MLSYGLSGKVQLPHFLVAEVAHTYNQRIFPVAGADHDLTGVNQTGPLACLLTKTGFVMFYRNEYPRV